MKAITGLYIAFITMHLVTLTNITMFEGEMNGIVMWLNTGLFIAGTTFYVLSRKGERTI